mgnify:CR=1 FL=1
MPIPPQTQILPRTTAKERVYQTDESYRFGLNAFKVLGGSFAIGSYLAGRLGVDIGQLPYDRMIGIHSGSSFCQTDMRYIA